LPNCQGTHDLIAMDVRESYDAGSGQDQVMLRLFVNGGDAASGLKDVISLKVDGSGKTFDMRTSNNHDFQGTGFDHVGLGPALNDGTRFVIEGTMARSALGAVGAKLTDFHVEAWKGSTNGDAMKGSYHTVTGMGPASSSEGSDPQEYSRNEYDVRGPSYYVTLGMPGAQDVAVGVEQFAQLDIKNELRATAQSITATVSGADGVQARFHDPSSPSGEGYTDTLRIDLAKGASTIAHLALTGQTAGSSGTLTVTLTTDQGGRNIATLPYTVHNGGNPSDTDSSSSPSGGHRSPAPTAALLGLAALACAAARRRS
jgi:hypothetical protein